MSNLIIIGAPRSGTNMLRDILTSFQGVETWPCDEINYIWRHGNVFYPSDELPIQAVTPIIKNYIQNTFSTAREKYQAEVLLEKTCANSLRVPFVDAVIPGAKYIFIVRDGVDATGSAKIRWKAKIDISYIMEKVRFVPKLDLPIYALRYFWARLFRLFSRDDRLAFWGPALNDMDHLLKSRSLEEVCALQWQRCVDAADNAFANMNPDRVYRLRYEDFVLNPKKELLRVLNFIGLKATDDQVCRAVLGVSSSSLGKGRKALCDTEVKMLEKLLEKTLVRHGYK